jgi:hypothetical protein
LRANRRDKNPPKFQHNKSSLSSHKSNKIRQLNGARVPARFCKFTEQNEADNSPSTLMRFWISRRPLKYLLVGSFIAVCSAYYSFRSDPIALKPYSSLSKGKRVCVVGAGPSGILFYQLHLAFSIDLIPRLGYDEVSVGRRPLAASLRTLRLAWRHLGVPVMLLSLSYSCFLFFVFMLFDEDSYGVEMKIPNIPKTAVTIRFVPSRTSTLWNSLAFRSVL